MLKVNTVEQFHIVRYIQENFNVEAIEIELLDRNKVKVTDFAGDSAEFTYNKESGKVEMC